MMRKIVFVMIGALLSSIVFGFAVYVSGVSFEKMGIALYASEADQQRNFNIVCVAWIVFVVIGGWVGYRLQKKARSP